MTSSSVSPLTSLSSVDSISLSSLPDPDNEFSPPDSVSSSPPFWVEIPETLSAEEKVTYRPVSELPEGDYFMPLDEIVGQYPSEIARFYFARHQGGPCHRFRAGVIRTRHPGLLKQYKKRKRRGTLPFPLFDPSSGYVHPRSRIRNFVNLTSQKATASTAYGNAGLSAEESDDEDDYPVTSDSTSITSQEDDDFSEDEPMAPLRRSSRKQSSGGKARDSRQLPYSPKKTRSQKIEVNTSDDDDDIGPLRRSSRAKKTFTVLLPDSDYAHTSTDDYSSTVPRKLARLKNPRHKPIPAAYGQIRPVEDIDFDEESDDDTSFLRVHRRICEKCGKKPAHELLRDAQKTKNRKKGRKRQRQDADLEVSSDEEGYARGFGGWVRCLKCPVSSHWKCIPREQRDLIIKAIAERDRAAMPSSSIQNGTPEPDGVSEPMDIVPKRSKLECSETTEYLCAGCSKTNNCMGCEAVLCFRPDDSLTTESCAVTKIDDVKPAPRQLLFRCMTCKRPAHYGCLKAHGMQDSNDIAQYYQEENWLCSHCSSFVYKLDKIIAWRPYPVHVIEPDWPKNEPNHWKRALPREYLVKWEARPYRRAQWGIPHMWLVSTSQAKLRNFFHKPQQVNEDRSFPNDESLRASSTDTTIVPGPSGPIPPSPNALDQISLAWKTIDRVLDVLLWKPVVERSTGKRKARQVISENDSDESDTLTEEKKSVRLYGRQPSEEYTETVAQFERRTQRRIEPSDIGSVAWGFFKWCDLGYEDAAWDTPPVQDDPLYIDFSDAFKRFTMARRVIIPKRSNQQRELFNNRPENEYKNEHMLKEASDLLLGQDPNLKLMPFQVEGFNWLCNNWWIRQPCILADEMGLGKTVQIASFIGSIVKKWNASPALVVVPNSTITNWMREFQCWAPELTVVPFYGETHARDVIKRFELKHTAIPSGGLDTRFHVLIATYESLIGAKDFTPIFKNQPCWEVLVIDEGQRLKNDSSLLFKKLNELKTTHRVIMTGTPLNNNIRELFNLMNFLDPENWGDLEILEREYEELTEELVKDLHSKLRPYFLRRTKDEVLALPQKNEVIVPVSMSALQKKIYKGILSHNAELLKGLVHPVKATRSQPVKFAGKITNVLMELRKVLQHPYLHHEDIEDRNLSPSVTHERLIDASAKLRFLRLLLPRLKERGHRVLLFSQFKLVLNIVEDFLNGEGYQYLRLDGDVKNSVRQRGMDEFNKPGSDVFIYLLTTRAGGVGINLYTANTVIIFDPDFNPHQDLQAIARAHRFGQKKTCLVFKLMVKDSAEERIVQIGKKKLVLDHLIVQKMDEDDDGGEDVQSILTHGAKALFDSDQGSRDITYTDHDVLQLIERTESQAPEEEKKSSEAGLSFSFAKVWTTGNNDLQEIQDDDQVDSWANTLSAINEELEKEQTSESTQLGRGVRRAATKSTRAGFAFDGDSPVKPTQESKKRKEYQSDGSNYAAEDSGDETESTSGELSPGDIGPGTAITSTPNTTAPPSTTTLRSCGLCGGTHLGPCAMTDDSQNLAEYREMLFQSNGEPWDVRHIAICSIDEELHRRGAIDLIAGQPLHFTAQRPTQRLISQTRPAQSSSLPHPLAGSSNSHASTSASGFATKRPASPLAQAPHKRPKILSHCPVCQATPFHDLAICPIVKDGSESIADAMKRLDAIPGNKDTVANLRRALSRIKKLKHQPDDNNQMDIS